MLLYAILFRFIALCQRFKGQASLANVASAWTDQAIVRGLLNNVRAPASDTGGDEQWRVKVDVQAQIVVQPGTRPVEVRVKTLLVPGETLDALRDFFQFAESRVLGEPGTVILQDDSPFFAVS
jgi:hypothetical protein